MKKIKPLQYLERSDKWYLGSGNKLLFAPPFPAWLDYPGFWDKAHYYNYEIEPAFTWTILDEAGNECFLKGGKHSWDPAKLTTRFEICDSGIGKSVRFLSDIDISETKCCLPNDILSSTVTIKNLSRKKRRLTFVAWTIQPGYPSKKTTWISDVKVLYGRIHYTKQLSPVHESDISPIAVSCTLEMSKEPESFSINLSEGSAIQPHWRLTPFVETMDGGKLPNEIKLSGVNSDGLMYLALQTRIELKAMSEENINVFFSVATKKNRSRKTTVVPKPKDPVRFSEKYWNEYFSSVPYFECSDEYLSRYYWYRWYGLKLNTIEGSEGNYKYPSVCEGIGYFRAPISYSAMCHILENRWMHDPALAQGSLLTFLEHQRNDGGLRGYIDLNFFRQEMFYHANWGNSLMELHKIHPDKKYLKKVYDGLTKYVAYFDRERDKKKSGLYDIENHYETGQEYMHRYIAVNPNADKDNWGEVFRLKGVDVTVYMYELKKALSRIADLLGRRQVAKQWSDGATKIKNAMLHNMWDSKEEMFFDVIPQTGERTNVKTATCFYPYMTDIVDVSHIPGLKKHLLNPDEFWTKFPLPSSSVDDKYFSSVPEWKGKRMNCPWNGRVWPMTNSHIAEALAQSALCFHDNELKEKSVEFILKFIKMMFYDRDPQKPNCFEHYNPFTGKPSYYRGIDDYQHSWVVDLIIKYVAGVRPMENYILIDPFPFNIQSFQIEGVFVRGMEFSVEKHGRNLTILVDKKYKIVGVVGTPIVVKG